VFYGLDWVATIPPTVRLTGEAFGRENTASSTDGSARAISWGVDGRIRSGAIRTELGQYQMAFWIAGTLCLLAGLSFVTVGRRAPRTAVLSEPALA
jgi:hypothetical protein